MALKNVLSWCSGVPQLGWGDLYSRRSGISFNWRKEVGGVCKWESYGVSRLQRPIMCIEDENQLAPNVEVEKIVDQKEDFKSKEFQKDFSSLRRPLSATNVSVFPSDSSNIRVAYQGIPGAYSEVAALKAFPQCEAVPCDKFEAAFKAVELCLADKAVLPIENSLDGSILQNYDLLFHHSLHIVGEVKLAVDHCLLGLPGVRKEDLKRVLSHPQALAQCELTLSKLGVVKESMDDTTGAAQFIASNKLRDTGAIASARAALSYGLNILAERIQDDFNNITRFLILAREPIIPRTDRPFKTSIVFTLVEGPGVLCRALSIFALRDINLTKIECRPQTKQHMSRIVDDNNGSFKLFESIFYIDFEASMAEVRAQNVLEHLQEFASFLRVLGSYPVDTTI